MSLRLVSFFALPLLALAPAAVSAATIEVDTLADDPATGCTLREALASANADSAAGNGCTDGSGADRIVLAAGTYTVGAELTVTSEVVVVGAGVAATILDAGAASHRIFGAASGSVFGLSDLRLTNGRGQSLGGALLVSAGGEASLERVRVDGSQSQLGGAVRVSSGGRLLVHNSEFDNNVAAGSGGAIQNQGELIVVRSRLHDNSATNHGGAIHVHPQIGAAFTTIADSLFTANQATNNGGAFSSSFSGDSATSTITNSTFSGNSTDAQGGALNVQGGNHTLHVAGLTVTDNQAANLAGGLRATEGATLAITNSIVAGNTATNGAPDCTVAIGASSVEHHNLVGDSTGCVGMTSATNVLDTAAGLVALSNNGGPTETHALEVTSPARGLGDCVAPDGTLLASDQRGVSRTTDGACTIGAFDPFAVLVRTSEEPQGSNCEQGGTRIETGTDRDDNGSLETLEVTSTVFVCRDLTGAALVEASSEPAGENCAIGGLRVNTGIDADGDGALQDSEVTETSFVCNGAGGADGANGADGGCSVGDRGGNPIPATALLLLSIVLGLRRRRVS